MNHQSNWATLALIWLIGLVGCSDYGGSEQPPQQTPEASPIDDPNVTENTARTEAWKDAIAVHKLLQEWDGEYHETYFTDDPRALEFFPGWPTKEVTLKNGRKVLRAWCDRDDCFAPGFGNPTLDPDLAEASLLPNENDQIQGTGSEVPKRLGRAEQSYCASGVGTLCPGPWNKHVGDVVPDNRTHTVCRYPLLMALFNSNPDFEWEVQFLAGPYGWSNGNMNVVELSNTDCPGWGYRNFTDLELADPEDGTRVINDPGAANIFRWAPVYADGGADSQGRTGYHQTHPVADVLFYDMTSQSVQEANCPAPDFTDQPHPLLGCTTAWFLFPRATNISPCYWQKYQVQCPNSTFCPSGCPYHRVAAWAIGLIPANIDVKADFYGIDRWYYRTHVACHELGHSVGLTHYKSRVGQTNSMRIAAYNSCMSAVHPGATDYWGVTQAPCQTVTQNEICEMRGGYPTKIQNGQVVCDTSQTLLDSGGTRLYGTTDY